MLANIFDISHFMHWVRLLDGRVRLTPSSRNKKENHSPPNFNYATIFRSLLASSICFLPPPFLCLIILIFFSFALPIALNLLKYHELKNFIELLSNPLTCHLFCFINIFQIILRYPLQTHPKFNLYLEEKRKILIISYQSWF